MQRLMDGSERLLAPSAPFKILVASQLAEAAFCDDYLSLALLKTL